MRTELKLQLASVYLLTFFFVVGNAQSDLKIPWSSLNGGGAIFLPDSSRQLSFSVGQSIIGLSQMDSLEMQMGFWSRFACLAIPGDVDGTPPVSLPDVIYLVNYVFDKDRPATGCLGSDPGNCWTPRPLCRGEVNGTPPVSLPDVIHLVNYVFDKGRVSPPCKGTDAENCWIPVPSDVCCLPLP